MPTNSFDSIFRLRNAAAASAPNIKRALERIGSLLRAQMVINITNYRAIDTGNLRSSIRYEINESASGYELSVGSYGVPYARVIEYGFSGTQNVKAHPRRIRQAFGRQLENERIVMVRAHSRYIPEGSRPGRPFMRDALSKHKDNIIDILRQELGV